MAISDGTQALTQTKLPQAQRTGWWEKWKSCGYNIDKIEIKWKRSSVQCILILHIENVLAEREQQSWVWKKQQQQK